MYRRYLNPLFHFDIRKQNDYIASAFNETSLPLISNEKSTKWSFIYWNWLWFVNTYWTLSHHPYLFPSANFFGFTQNLSFRFIFYMWSSNTFFVWLVIYLLTTLSFHNSPSSLFYSWVCLFFLPVYRLYIHPLVSSMLLLRIFTSISVQ